MAERILLSPEPWRDLAMGGISYSAVAVTLALPAQWAIAGLLVLPVVRAVVGA